MGLVYDADGIRLYHGDCLDALGWLDADVLVTDPPYGMGWDPRGLASNPELRTARDGLRGQAHADVLAGDESTLARDGVLSLWGDRPAVVFGTWRVARPGGVAHRLIWHKAGRQPGIASSAVYPVDEEIYLLGSGWRRSRRRTDSHGNTVWEGTPTPSVITTTESRSREPGRVGHPTPKPVWLMEQLLRLCPDGMVADPFAGSGATLLAARMLGRQAVGVEVDERYCDVIIRRMSQGTLFDGAVDDG